MRSLIASFVFLTPWWGLLALTGLLAVMLGVRVRYENLVWYLGLLLLVSVIGGPAAWPW